MLWGAVAVPLMSPVGYAFLMGLLLGVVGSVYRKPLSKSPSDGGAHPALGPDVAGCSVSQSETIAGVTQGDSSLGFNVLFTGGGIPERTCTLVISD